MTTATEKAQAYLRRLCVEIPNRRTGSPGNREATTFFADIARSHGFAIAAPVFDCVDWEQAGVNLKVGDNAFAAFASPYSAGCRVEAALALVSTVEELEAAEAAGKILLLTGDLTREQLMPKNFPFYNPARTGKFASTTGRKWCGGFVAQSSGLCSRNPEDCATTNRRRIYAYVYYDRRRR